jgi:hypothetical protein
MRRTLATITVLAILGAPALHAQAIVCVSGSGGSERAPCVIERGGKEELIIVRILDSDNKPLREAKVTFQYGRGVTDNSAMSDVNGLAVLHWTPWQDIGNASDTVRVTATYGTKSANQLIVLRPPTPVNTLALSSSAPVQAWYAGHQLPEETLVAIPMATAAQCTSLSVLFKPMGATAEVAPDTARAEFDLNQCVARTRWKLAPNGGVQVLRAGVIGSTAPPIIVRAKARKEPWLAAGLALTYDTGFNGVDSIKAEAATATAPATAATTKGNHSDAHIGFAPTIGVNTPLLTRWAPLRVSASADVQHVKTDWYVGFSIPQLYDGLWHEDMGVDLQLVAHIGKRAVVEDSTTCATTCKTEDHTRVVGVALNVQLNATVLWTALATLFPK